VHVISQPGPVVIRKFDRDLASLRWPQIAIANDPPRVPGHSERRRMVAVATPKLQILTAYQIAIAMIVTTIVHHITGVTCFEPPLRGESLAA
jgi:hypothetical protein